MDKKQIADLLIQIKTFYSRFDSVEKIDGHFRVSPSAIDSWYSRLGYMEYDRAVRILDQYMESENGNKTPNIALWLRGGKLKEKAAWHNAWLDRRNGLIIWQPEGGPKFELKATYNTQRGGWEDEDGRLWAMPGEE